MKLLLILTYFFGLIPITAETQPTTSTILLAGTTQKSWYLYSQSPESHVTSCTAASTLSQDNNWIFFANGTIEFDHGAITEDANCQEEDCCSDMINFIGSWAFANTETTLIVNALHEKNNPSNAFNSLLFNTTITQLTENSLVLSTTAEDGTIQTMEFRAR